MNKEQMLELAKRWAKAELEGDANTLNELAAPDFIMIGPRGFVLTREQWVNRYRTGDLKNQSFVWKDENFREFGDVAILIGTQTQQTTYQGQPNNGSFKASLVFGKNEHGWKINHIQLSGPMMAMGQSR